MNQQTQELLKQATDDIMGMPIVDHKKFAELIVRECCKVLQTESVRHDGYGYNQFGLHNKLREHFGVEE